MVPSSQRKESTLDFLKYARDLQAHRILSVKNPKHGATYKKRLYIVRYEKALFQCRKGG